MTDRPDVVKIWRSRKTGDWWWTRRAPNGEVIATSAEGYTSHGEARVMAGRVNMGCVIKDSD